MTSHQLQDIGTDHLANLKSTAPDTASKIINDHNLHNLDKVVPAEKLEDVLKDIDNARNNIALTSSEKRQPQDLKEQALTKAKALRDAGIENSTIKKELKLSDQDITKLWH